MTKIQLIRSLLLLSFKFDTSYFMEGWKGEFLLGGLTVIELVRALKQVTQFLRAGLQLVLSVADHRRHQLIPARLALPNLLYQIDGSRCHQTRSVVQEFRLQQGQLKDVLGQVLVLGLQSNHFGKGLEEFVARVHDEFEVEFLDDLSLLLKNLSSCVLSSAARHELFGLGDLVSLFELGSDVERSHSHQLQLAERDLLDAEVLVDEGDDGEDSFGEHLVFVVELAEPVDELGAGLFGDGLVGGDVVDEFVGLLLLAAEELEILTEVFGDHLGVVDFGAGVVGLLVLGELGAVDEAIGDVALVEVEGMVADALSMQEGVVALVPVDVGVDEVGQFLPKDAGVHVSVKLINYN